LKRISDHLPLILPLEKDLHLGQLFHVLALGLHLELLEHPVHLIAGPGDQTTAGVNNLVALFVIAKMLPFAPDLKVHDFGLPLLVALGLVPVQGVVLRLKTPLNPAKLQRSGPVRVL